MTESDEDARAPARDLDRPRDRDDGAVRGAEPADERVDVDRAAQSIEGAPGGGTLPARVDTAGEASVAEPADADVLHDRRGVDRIQIPMDERDTEFVEFVGRQREVVFGSR
ncbi:hypothetical protein [Frankia sp. AgB32]|uniref:hypothetical protein n=1 Tax=Frankia sp. AgB32 TaxID=631119 RepID=UPI00200CF83D|nr:hypothetical protein [Frankia sp. AgB32]MCK9896015.1 hypothetical protein [Frankia sp. AgB32]